LYICSRFNNMSEKKDILVGNAACGLAYLLFGFNTIACKNIANYGGISPMALFCMRAIGALALFWMASAIVPKGEKMDPRDLWKVALASFLGLFLTQISFLVAITMTTPVDASLLNLLSPILTMIIAAIAIKEKITSNSIIGLSISLAGVLFIVLNNSHPSGGVAETKAAGVLLMIANALCFACYVGIFKPLTQKYHVITFMKWMFVFAVLFSLPFGIKDLGNINYSQIPTSIILQVLFVVIGATFIAYFLIPIGQKRLKPMVVCMYTYLNPLIAMTISYAVGMDVFSWKKLIAAIFIFLGLGICNFSPRKAQS